MPFQPIHSIELHYQHLTESTSRPDIADHFPLLMLSGMASDSASWQPVVQALEDHVELLIPDNRCTGQTRPNPVETSRELMVADVLALLDALDIQKVNILGHSMGAMLGWALAAQAPERVNHLISASALPWVIPARVSLFNSLSTLRSSSNEADWFELLYQFLFSPSFFENKQGVKQAVEASMSYPHKQSIESFATQTAALSTFLSPIDIDKVDCTVSMLTGSNDLLMTPSLLQAFCAQYEYTFTVIDNAAHAIHWEQAEAFVAFVLNELGIKP